MSFDDNINAYFVITSNSEASNEVDEIKTALTLLRNHISEDHIRQIKASEGYPLIASGRLTKKDVFIFDKFEGDFFAQLQQTKSLIVGPRCLTTCLLKCEPIPLGTSPVYTTAMRDLQISASGITPQEKERLRGLIQWMGGHYFQNFGRSITHLISNTIKSTKYEHATLNGIPVMHVDWVQRVWERSCIDNVSATDDEFDKYKLPIFFGTNITCTGLDTDKKNEVMRMVNENGGTYHRAFRSQLVDIVITEKSKTNSDKYQAAVRYKKEILLPDWIFNSVQKGFALPTKPYQVKAMKVSTPTKTDQSIADFTSTDQTHLSDISRISILGSKRNGGDLTLSDTICTLNETQTPAGVNTFAAPPAPKDLQREVLKKAGAGAHYKLILDEICPKQAKKAGTFLDGCCIYLSGFRTEEKEKLNRILNLGGATRYDVINEKITHIIVGQLDDAEYKAWKRDGLLTAINIVRLDWLLESIKLKQAASEVVYRMSLPNSREPDAPSPSSKKTLRSMNHSFKQPDLPKTKKKLFQNDTSEADASPKPTESNEPITAAENMPVDVDEDENMIVAQYSQEHEPIATPLPLPDTSAADKSTLLPPIASSTQCAQQIEQRPLPPTDSDKTAAVKATAAPQPNPPEITETAMSTIDYEHLDFFQGMSLFIDKQHFPEEFYSQMINECEAAQGNVVAESFRDPIDYAIVSFECTLDVSTLPVKARHVITELYVEACMKENKLVPIEYYHKPIPHTADAQPLGGMTIVISLYAGLERDYIDSIAQLLGAKVNKTFVKKEKPLLVCPSPEGSKYEGALKWRYPVVTSAWLVQCAIEGRKLAYQPYLVGNSSEDFPISPTLRERNVTVEGTNSVVREAAVAPMPIPMDTDTRENVLTQHNKIATPVSTQSANSSPDFTPLRNKRVSELAGPARSSRNSLSNTNSNGSTPESPHTPVNNYGRPSYNFDFMETILAEIENEAERECLREVIMEMRNNQTPELERIRRQACTPINRKIPTPKGIPDFCTTPEFEKRMADEFERRWRLPTKKMKPDTPIDEIRRRVMRATCKAMGIPFNSDDEHSSVEKEKNRADALTPQRNSSNAPRTIFAAKQSPRNVTSCDTLVPGTQTPNGSGGGHDDIISIMPGTGPGQRASIVGKSTINFDKISFEETSIANNSNSPASSGSKQSIAAASPELKQITDYLKNCESRRQSLKQRSVGTRVSAQQAGGTEVMENDTEAHYVQPFESEQFGAGTEEEIVGWRDPAEFSLERRKLQVPTIQHKGTPRFSISCSDEETRNDLITRILRLGGEVCENLVNFDPECTHFVCERPNRGEKMLGCISSGKWVLSLKYIEECSAKGVFVDEELYEWGNGKAVNIPKLTQDELTIAAAAHRWRKQLTEAAAKQFDDNIGAFSGFRSILRISERNLDALKNVIKAGNGEIIEAQSPYSESPDAHLATHCFVDVKKMPLTQRDYDFLRENGVNVLTQMYINSYLMNGSNADFAKYEIKM